MSRITKQIAEDTAKAMTAEKANEVKKLKGEFKEAVRQVALLRVPEAVKAFHAEKEFEPYVNMQSYFSLCGHGFEYKGVYVEDIPWNCGQGNRLDLSKEEGKLLWDMEKAYKNADKKTKELESQIFVALYETLKTYKKVEEHFPEAYQHLPKLSGVTALSINLDALRQKIAQ